MRRELPPNGDINSKTRLAGPALKSEIIEKFVAEGHIKLIMRAETLTYCRREIARRIQSSSKAGGAIIRATQ